MKCDFCKKDIPEGTGKVYVKNIGKVFHFCSSKCENHMIKFKRKPASLKWVKE